MNHLEMAQESMKEYHSNFQVNDAIAGTTHALIAIAEQLEKMNEKYLKHDTFCTCYECTKHIKFIKEDK